MFHWQSEEAAPVIVVTDCHFLQLGILNLPRNLINRPTHFIDIDRMGSLEALRHYIVHKVGHDDVIVGIHRNRILSRHVKMLGGLSVDSSVSEWDRAVASASRSYDHRRKWLALIDHRAWVTDLSKRQQQIIHCMQKGRTINEISTSLSLSKKTIYGYMKGLESVFRSRSISELYFLVQER